jgi:hypothetical protein
MKEQLLMKHKNQKEYTGFYEEMKWIQPWEAAACEA